VTLREVILWLVVIVLVLLALRLLSSLLR